MLAFGVITATLQRLIIPLVPLWLLVLLGFALALRLLPHTKDPAIPTDRLPSRWDIPLRMIIATLFVLLITGLAPAFGPRLTGLLAPFPIFTTILASFALHQYGLEATINVLRGTLMGLFAFASFFFVIAILIEPAGILIAFLVAILVVIGLQGFSLWLLRRRPGRNG